MWVLFAFGSACFAGLTAVLAKCGMRRIDSHLATALRTGVVLLFAWGLVFLTGGWRGIGDIGPAALLLLLLSGLATGASWLCYFRALQLGDVNKVAPVDKSSTILTMALAFILFREPIGALQLSGILLMGAGTWLMVGKTPSAAGTDAGTDSPPGRKNKAWFMYAAASAVFASLTSILGKAGMQNIDSNLGTAIRTIVVLVMAWALVFVTGKQAEVRELDWKSWIFLILSGVTTGVSWLCYYRALQTGPASVVAPIDKLSILVTVLFSRLILKERLTRRAAVGLLLLTLGTLILLF